MSIVEEFVNFSEPAEAKEEKFVVDNVEKAEWCLRKIAKHEKKKAEAKAFVEAEKAKLEDFLLKVNADEEGSIEYFKSLLLPFAMQELQGSKKKTVKLPNGQLSFKKAAPKFEKEENTLLEFVKNSEPTMIKISEAVNWAEFKKSCTIDGERLITADGEVVKGVTVKEQADSFVVKTVEE